MTLFEAKEYDPSVEKRLRLYAIAGLVVLVILGFLVYHFWDWREEHAVNRLLTAIEHKDYEKAYAIWNADPDWKQHPQKYAGYNFGTFELDWGPTGEYGEVPRRSRSTLRKDVVDGGIQNFTVFDDCNGFS